MCRNEQQNNYLVDVLPQVLSAVTACYRALIKHRENMYQLKALDLVVLYG